MSLKIFQSVVSARSVGVGSMIFNNITVRHQTSSYTSDFKTTPLGIFPSRKIHRNIQKLLENASDSEIFETNDFEELLHSGYPKPLEKYVNDFAGILNDEDTRIVRDSLQDIDSTTDIEITVVSIHAMEDYPVLENTFESFVTGLFNAWGVGSAEQNDGVLFIISLEERKVRIEVGSGFPSSFNRSVQRVIDYRVIPLLKRNLYAEGVVCGVEEIVKLVTEEETFLKQHIWKIFAAALAFFLLLAGISRMKTGKSGWGGRFFNALFNFLNGTNGGGRSSSYRGGGGGGRSSGGGGFSGGGSSGGGGGGGF